MVKGNGITWCRYYYFIALLIDPNEPYSGCNIEMPMMFLNWSLVVHLDLPKAHAPNFLVPVTEAKKKKTSLLVFALFWWQIVAACLYCLVFFSRQYILGLNLICIVSQFILKLISLSQLWFKGIHHCFMVLYVVALSDVVVLAITVDGRTTLFDGIVCGSVVGCCWPICSCDAFVFLYCIVPG
jgi:hypothetical protein